MENYIDLTLSSDDEEPPAKVARPSPQLDKGYSDNGPGFGNQGNTPAHCHSHTSPLTVKLEVVGARTSNAPSSPNPPTDVKKAQTTTNNKTRSPDAATCVPSLGTVSIHSQYSILQMALNHYPAVVGARVWVPYGKKYLEAVLAHPLSDAGHKEVLEARVDRPAALVYFPPGSLPKSSRKVEWIPVKDIVIQKRHVPPKVPCRGIRGTSAVSPVEWWLKDLSTRLLDLSDRLPFSAVQDSNLDLWEMHSNNIKQATTYEQLAVEFQWMMNQWTRRLFTKHSHWANDEVSGMPALVRGCCQPPVVASKMDELLVLVSDRIDEDMVVSLWKEEKFDWHTHKDQAAELLLQPEDDPAVPEETKLNDPPPHTEDKGKQKNVRQAPGVKRLQDNQPRAAVPAAPSHREPTIKAASADAMLMQVLELMEGAGSAFAEGDACAEIVFGKLGIDFSHVDKKQLQKMRTLVRDIRVRIQKDFARNSKQLETMFCNEALLRETFPRSLSPAPRPPGPARPAPPSQNQPPAWLCALCHQVVFENESVSVDAALMTEELGPPIATCCGRELSRCTCKCAARATNNEGSSARETSDPDSENDADWMQCPEPPRSAKPKPQRGRNFKKAAKSANAIQVVHQRCAAWSPLVVRQQDSSGAIRYKHIKILAKGTRICDLTSEVRRGEKHKCKLCGLWGATIGCQVVSCRSSFHYSCVLNSGCEYNPSTRQVYCHIHAQPAGSEWQHTGEWQSWDEEQRSVTITPPAPAPPVARKHPRSRAGELPIGMGGQRVQYEDLHSEPPDEAREGWESEMEDDQPGAPGLANGMLRNGQPSATPGLFHMDMQRVTDTSSEDDEEDYSDPYESPPESPRSEQRAVVLCPDLSYGVERVPVRCVVDRPLHSQQLHLPPLPQFKYIRERDLGGLTLDPGAQMRCSCAHLVGRGCCGGSAHVVGGSAHCEHVQVFDYENPGLVGRDGLPMSGRLAYGANGRIMVPHTAAGVIYECNSECGCKETCRNRVLQRGLRLSLEVFHAGGKGWGVRARQPVKAGVFVCEYVGELISNDEATRRGKIYDAQGCSYLYDIDAHVIDEAGRKHTRTQQEHDEMYVLDAAHCGNLSRFVNHSCEPNCAVYSVLYDTAAANLAHIGLYAIKDIWPGEELTYNYCYSLLKGKGMACGCGAQTCRGRLY